MLWRNRLLAPAAEELLLDNKVEWAVQVKVCDVAS